MIQKDLKFKFDRANVHRLVSYRAHFHALMPCVIGITKKSRMDFLNFSNMRPNQIQHSVLEF